MPPPPPKVRADTYVLDADQRNGMIDVIDQVLNGRRWLAGEEGFERGDLDHTAIVAQRKQCFVIHVARVIGQCRTLEWEAITGALERRMAECAASLDACETSTMIPSSFMRAMARAPRSLMPPCSTGSSPNAGR
jgi:hypothetical protein